MTFTATPPREVVRQDGAEARFLGRRRALIRLLLANAKDLALIQESRHYEVHECSSIRDYGERVLSVSAREASETAAIGRAVRTFPELEGMLLDGRTTPEAAAALEALTRHAEAIRSDDQWLLWAEKETAKTLRKRIAKRLREIGEGRPHQAITLRLSPQGVQDLATAQVLAGKSEKDLLDRSRTVEVVLRHFVKAKDPLEGTPGTRRMTPTDSPGAPKSRAVAAEVVREVFARADGKCRIPFCDNDIFVHKVHVFRTHADGGSREAENLDLHCARHHGMQEVGRIRNLGTTARPRFVDARGEPMDRRRIPGNRPALPDPHHGPQHGPAP